MIGMFNDVIEGFLAWVNGRCDKIPDNKRFACGNMFEVEFGLKVAEADIKVWIASNEEQLECIKGEVECLKEEKMRDLICHLLAGQGPTYRLSFQSQIKMK